MSLIRYFIIFIFITMFHFPVNAEKVKKIGKFKDWETMILKKDSGLVCFAQTKPILQSPKKNPRDARLFVSFRPNEKIIDEISITAGYEFNKKNSPLTSAAYASSILDLPPLRLLTSPPFKTNPASTVSWTK